MWPLTGHDRIVSYLKRSLEKGSLSHAYLITGPGNIGKMTMALSLAQAVNCAAHDKPCGACPECQKIASRVHPDVQIIRLLAADEADDKKAKTELVIEQVRKLQHWASLPPFEGRCSVFIFEQAELLNEEAANCLLKTLEEPLPNVLFILLAPGLAALPETVVSRCQCLELKPVPVREIEGLLLDRGMDPSRAGMLARMSRGGPGWAINAMEHEDVYKERSERLEKILDLVSKGYEERFESVEELTGRSTHGRTDLNEVIRDWRDLWRDLLLIKSGQPDNVINIGVKDRLAMLSTVLKFADIRAFLSSLSNASDQVIWNVNPRLIFEVLMLDLPRLDKARMKG